MRLSVLILALILLACNAQKDSKKSTNNSVFVYCSEGSPSAFNPQIVTDGTSITANMTMYNSLVGFAHGDTKIVPELAKSYEISKDKLTYTFHLRKDVSFHNTDYFSPTRLFNADDVLWSFNRMRKEDHPYHKTSGGTYEYFSAMEMGKIIKDLKKLDDYTIQITLSKPEAPFLANLAMPFASILSKEYGEKLIKENAQEKIDQLPIGTGPYSFKKYQKDSIIRFETHPQYFEGAPKISKLVFSITPDASVRFQKLKTGECHFINEPAPADIKSMVENKNINVLKKEGLNVGYLAFNTSVKPFSNQKVRLAINHALNRDSYIDAIYLGNAVVAKNPLPPTIWGYHESNTKIDHNTEVAKKLLKEAGYPNGFETELWTLPVSRPYNPNGKKMGELIQSDLAKIGIKVKLVTFDWPTYLAKSRKGQHQMLQLGWTGDNGDPDNFLNTLLSCASVEAGSNVARWCNKDYDKVVKEAKSTSDVEVRTNLYKKAQEIFKKEVPWVTLAHSMVYRAMRDNVKGYKINPLGYDVLKKISLE